MEDCLVDQKEEKLAKTRPMINCELNVGQNHLAAEEEIQESEHYIKIIHEKDFDIMVPRINLARKACKFQEDAEELW